MSASLEETLISVWRQALAEPSKTVTLEGGTYPVRSTSRSKLREVDFRFEEQTLRGLEQNPNTNSRWAQLAREGKKVMQFLSDGRYIANVADGKLQFYGRHDRARSTAEQKSTTT
jgi:fructose-1,6-bisphosphatase/inositol monophosphatase family enzyme